LPRHPELRAALAVIAVLAAFGAAIFLAVREDSGGPPPPARSAWQGLVGDAHPAVSTEQRQIVVLSTPSVADRLAEVRYATEDDERRWSAQAYAVQQQVLALLASRGLGVRPEFSYSKVLNGFSAIIDARATAVLNSVPEVEGVYPVRAAFPAAVSAEAVSQVQSPVPGVRLPGYDGRGLTIALLDTGVDRRQPYLGGRVEAGLDVVDGTGPAVAETSPEDESEIERHGTQMAGLLVGSGGPGGMRGVAPGATVFPIRVAGWQPDAEGRSVVYARTDQLIAGLERAVDPDGDGDAHDAARIALVGVAAPFASFADSPESRAIEGALALDTLVVAPAGNDGSAGPLYGSVAGPGGSPAAVTVGATDERPVTASARVVLRRGLEVLLDEELPLLATGDGSAPGNLAIGLPRGAGTAVMDYFDRGGFSLVAGRAALVPVGDDPGAAALAAAHAGARAVLLYGRSLPSGSLGISSDVGVPVVAAPAQPVEALLRAQSDGYTVGVAVGRVLTDANSRVNRVAAFSSRGLSFGAFVKPDLTAPGTALPTSDPGNGADGEPAYVSVNGTSAAAASVAGAAALLAQARPGLSALDLRSLLVGYALPAPAAPLTNAGLGEIDVGAGAAAEVVASTATLGLGAWLRRARATETFTIRNISTRRLELMLAAPGGEGGTLRVRVKPARTLLRPGQSRRVTVTATGERPRGERAPTGVITVTALGGRPLRIPWSTVFPPKRNLLPRASIRPSEFRPSDVDPAILRIRAGAVVESDGVQIVPLARLDVLLYTADGEFVGLLARLRDLLPGTYAFGITGRGPRGARLPPGGYEVRLLAWPVLTGEPTRRRVPFRIERPG
jgi:subtilisin family serine protease